MITEMAADLYRIDVPLPNNPLKTLNSYLIKGCERNLLIDTGLNLSECRQAVLDGLKALAAPLNKTELFLTHLHPDHSGLIFTLVREGAPAAFCGREDEAILNSDRDMTAYFNRFISMCGFPSRSQKALASSGFGMTREGKVGYSIAEESDVFAVGSYLFQCVKAPGHAPGHICLYARDQGILISGDHILAEISPNVSLWTDEGNPLQNYIDSLQRAGELKARLILPGHRQAIDNPQERIEELLECHRVRTSEVLTVLDDRKSISIYEVAKQLTWKGSHAFFADFPFSQKLFAAGETMAHLKYLEEAGKVMKDIRNGVIYYRLA